jgi:hypothetical protein
MPAANALRTEENYRPVAGLAVAGLVLAGLFAVWVVANAAVGMVKGRPFLMSNWFYLLPVAGAGLSFVAQRQIRNAEGTRAGLALTRWGLWLSVFFGVGYAAYAVATDFAVRRQAEDFLFDPSKGFFALLKQPTEVNAAFLLTRTPDRREGLNPQNDEMMQKQFGRDLAAFLGNNLVRIVRQGGKDAEVKIQEMTAPTYQEGGYWVHLKVGISTKDEIVSWPLTVCSRDTRRGREWFVNWRATADRPDPKDSKLTSRGEKVMALRADSHQFARQWLAKLTAGKLKKSECLPRGRALDLTKIRDENTRVTVRHLLDEFCDPDAGEYPKMDARFTCCIVEQQAAGPQAAPSQAVYQVDQANHRLQFIHEMNWMFFPPQLLRCALRLIVERTGPDLFDYDPNHPPSWRVVRLEVTQAMDPFKDRPRR